MKLARVKLSPRIIFMRGKLCKFMRKAFLLRDFALRIACAPRFFLLELLALLFVRLGFAK